MLRSIAAVRMTVGPEVQFICPRSLAEELPSLLERRGYEVAGVFEGPIRSEGISFSSFRCKDREAEVCLDIVTPPGFHDCFVVVAARTARRLIPLRIPRREKRLVQKIAALLDTSGAVRCVIQED